MLGDWVVLFADEDKRPASAEQAFALVGYEQDLEGGEQCYRFRHCLRHDLQRFHVEFADGPLLGIEVSPVPALWLPAELVRPLDAQARAIREPDAGGGASRVAYLAHYQRQDHDGSNKYHLFKISPKTPISGSLALLETALLPFAPARYHVGPMEGPS